MFVSCFYLLHCCEGAVDGALGAERGTASDSDPEEQWFEAVEANVHSADAGPTQMMCALPLPSLRNSRHRNRHSYPLSAIHESDYERIEVDANWSL